MAKLILPGNAGKKVPPISDLLDEAFEEGEVGGPSGFGWHATATYMSCQRKAFYKIAQGLRRKNKASNAINFGTLMHACLALHYRDPTRTHEPIEVVREHYPELAKEAEMTLKRLELRYAKWEEDHWDPRGTEFEARYDFEGKPSFSDELVIPAFFTCRFDLIVGIKEKGEPRKPLGERVDFIRGVDHKFHGRMYWDLIPGYRWDAQFIAQTLIWREAKLDEIVGNFQGVTVSIFIRERNKQDPMARLNLKFDTETVDNFQRTVEQHILDCHAKLLYHRDDINMWPQNFTGCQTKYGLCPFYELCESNDRLRHIYEQKSSLTDRLKSAVKKEEKETNA